MMFSDYRANLVIQIKTRLNPCITNRTPKVWLIILTEPGYQMSFTIRTLQMLYLTIIS